MIAARCEAPVNILGVPVQPWDGELLIDAMVATATGQSRHDTGPLGTVHYANVHVLNTAYRNPELRRQLTRASTVYCDGSGVRLGAALLGQRLPPRLTAADWIDSFCALAAAAGVRLFIIAGEEGVAERAADVLRARHPAVLIAGTHHGYLDDTNSTSVVERVNSAGAGIVLVGMGTPAQELWVARHRERIAASVVWTVGAVFDFVVGAQSRAPRWVRDLHLEWLWRLGTSPVRLGGRYMVGNPLFIVRVVWQRVTGRTTRTPS
jgi:N-acetylglucosaminyldiphosphoundecaprenol N-acetyl-beta-D-mannosaminyltransferase